MATDEQYFTFDEGSNTITGYSNEGPKNVEIPLQINGIDVLNIGNDAFANFSLTSIILIDSILDIGERAFMGNLLTTISIPLGVTILKTKIFYDNKITSFFIPKNIIEIQDGVLEANPLSVVTFEERRYPISFGSSLVGKIEGFWNNQPLSPQFVSAWNL